MPDDQEQKGSSKQSQKKPNPPLETTPFIKNETHSVSLSNVVLHDGAKIQAKPSTTNSKIKSITTEQFQEMIKGKVEIDKANHTNRSDQEYQSDLSKAESEFHDPIQKLKDEKEQARQDFLSIELTQDQNDCISYFIDFIQEIFDDADNSKYDPEADNQFRFTIDGVAGSGKSTVLQFIVQELIQMNFKVALTATTHKATQVLREMSDLVDNECDIETIHSVLGYRQFLRDDGDYDLAPDPDFEKKNYDVLIVDECSMVGGKLFLEIFESGYKCVLFVGDRCQIEPVNEERSFTFDEEYIDHIQKLDQVVRTSSGNPIIELATSIRKSQNPETRLSGFPEITTKLVNGKGVHWLSKGEFTSLYMEKLKNIKHRDDLRMIGYTNRTVDMFNHFIKTAITGSDNDFDANDIIIAQESKESKNKKELEFRNGDEFLVLSARTEIDKKWNIRYTKLKLHAFVPNFKGRSYFKDIEVVHSSSQDHYDEILKELRNDAKQSNDKRSWPRYYLLKRRFTKFKHWYCCTAHKSQGSTFKDTFVLLDDFSYHQHTLNGKKLFYTSVTRASKNVYISDFVV